MKDWLSGTTAGTIYIARIKFAKHASLRVNGACQPSPVPYLRQILAILADLGGMFRQLAFDEAGESFLRRGERGNTFDHRLGEMETVEDGHVEGRRGRAFLLVAMDVEVGMVGASIGQSVNEPGIARDRRR